MAHAARLRPGTYIMIPKRCSDAKQREGLTRTVVVESIESDNVRIVELTTRPLLWSAGDTQTVSRKKWKFSPVLPC